MEKIAICKNHKPSKIIEKDDTHYFYWPIEIGLGKIKIWKWKFPISPVKLHDYEPIKTMIIDGEMIAITRFHYDIFVYFNNLKITEDKKPIADFSFGSHSPLVYVNEDSGVGTWDENWIGADSREVIAFEMLVAMYKGILKGKITSDNCEVKDYELVDGEIPEDAVFETSSMNALISIGRRPNNNELRQSGFNV